MAVDAIMDRQALGVAWLPSMGEGLRQTSASSGILPPGAKLLAQRWSYRGSSEFAA